MTTTDGGNSKTPTNYFTELSNIDCSKHVQKKGKFSYLSWPWAIKTLRERHPDAEIEVVRFPSEPRPFDSTAADLPYLKTELGYFVETSVTVARNRLNHIHPILDHHNKPISKPSAFDVNTSIMRCLVKNIALHGLGLYIYAGEDLPPDQEYTQEQYKQFHKLLEDGEPLAYVAFMHGLDVNTQTALYNSFPDKQVTKGKHKADALNNSGHDLKAKYVDTLREAAANNDTSQIAETVGELTDDSVKHMIWLELDADTRSAIKDALKEAA